MVMKHPNFNEEKRLWKKGYKCVVGLDEAGRGPLAGPVVAAAVCAKRQIQSTKLQINSKHVLDFGNCGLFGNCDFGFWISEVNDSKQLSSKKREQLYNIITTHPQVGWGVGVVSEKVIDKINILEATKLAMEKALKALAIKTDDRQFCCKPDFLLIDGNFKINFEKGGRIIPEKSIVRGDEKVFSIAAASIIAKVTRDRIMQKYHDKYPKYGFSSNKGYPTKAHFASLQKFGPCKIHRKTFHPIKIYGN